MFGVWMTLLFNQAQLPSAKSIPPPIYLFEQIKMIEPWKIIAYNGKCWQKRFK
jgi:hypothetical protein